MTTTKTRYALCSDVTPSRATVRLLADSVDDLCLTSAELDAAGLDDTVQILKVSADASIGDRIQR